MKSLLLSITLFLCSIFVFAQENFTDQSLSSKLKGDQFGLSYNGSNFSLLYKKQRDKGGYILYEGFANATTNQFENLNFGGGISAYRLKDHNVSDRFFISSGAGAGINLNVNASSSNQTFLATTSFGYRGEFNYRLNPNMYIGASITPSISLNTTFDSRNDNLNYNLRMGLSNSARIHFFYMI